MHYLKTKVQRRAFIKTIAKAGLTTAFTSQFLMSKNVFAQTGGAKRFVMVYYPNGCVRDRWHTYNTGPISGNSFANSPLMELSEYAHLLTPIKNLDLTGHGGSQGHPESCSGVFSGGQMNAPTFDVSLGHSLGGRHRENLHLGVWTSRTFGDQYLPFTGTDFNKIKSPENPQLVYDNNIADLVVENVEQNPEQKRRRRILESLHENLDVIQDNLLNVTQQDKLLTHEEALNYYQNILSGAISIGDPSGFSRPAIGMTGNDEDADIIAKEQMRNIAMAFEADITNCASFQFMSAHDESLKINFPAIRPYMGEYGSGEKLDHNEVRSHPSSHSEYNNDGKTDAFNAQTHWYNIVVAHLLEQLSARDDHRYGGKLIDNTLVLVLSETAGGQHDDLTNPGVYLAGGAGGAINTGVAIDAHNAGLSNLYLDITKAFGLNWDRYGNSYGGISGLLT